MSTVNAADPVRPGLGTRSRHDAILAELARSRRVEVSALAAGFDVAEETVRRDLRQLEGRDLLVRVHGGAVLPQAVIETAPPAPAGEEDPLVRIVRERLPSSGTFFLGAGSASLALAEALPDVSEIAIVTTSVDVALLASSRHESSIYSVGGAVHGDEQVGPWTNEILAEVHVDVALVETGALRGDGVVTVPSPRQAAARRLVVDGSDRRVLLVTGAPSAPGFVVAARADEFDLVISREPLPRPLSDRLREQGVEVVVAS